MDLRKEHVPPPQLTAAHFCDFVYGQFAFMPNYGTLMDHLMPLF